MPILTSCCCWERLSTGSRGSAVFTAVTAIINLIIDIWMLVHLHHLRRTLEDHEEYIYLPPGIIPIIYIELFFTLCLFGLAFVLWIGINYGYDGKKMVFAWVYGVIWSRIYEFFLLVYILVWIGGHRIMDVIYVVPESIGVAVYWLVDSIIMLAAILCVVSYWQELLDTIHGKEKRARYFTKLSNIRAAAFGSGTATPMRSLYASRAMLHASQPSIAQFSQYSVPPSMPPSAPVSAQPMGPGQFRYPPPQRPMGPGYGPPPRGAPMGPGQPRPMGPPSQRPIGPGYGPPMGAGPGYGPPLQRGGPYPPQERRGPPPDRRQPPQAMQEYFDEPPLRK